MGKIFGATKKNEERRTKLWLSLIKKKNQKKKKKKKKNPETYPIQYSFRLTSICLKIPTDNTRIAKMRNRKLETH